MKPAWAMLAPYFVWYTFFKVHRTLIADHIWDISLTAGRLTQQMDKVPALVRSEIMRRVRSEDTKPEMLVRRLVHSMGFRYRLHGKNLPGKPDLVFPVRHKAIFVHGCFWHRHARCSRGKVPQSNADFWLPKLAQNVKRDAKAIRKLKSCGWKVLVVWECRVQDSADLRRTIEDFLQE